MSRSYKKQPFQSVCGGGSARWDKFYAHKGERRAHKKAICQVIATQEYEDFLLPHRLECSHNEVYSWCRDGNQRFCVPDGHDWYRHIEATTDPSSMWYGDEHYTTWPPLWYKSMMRK